MEICSIVVWYNPTVDCVSNILTYSKKFSRVYIIDNTMIDNSDMARYIENSIYFPNFDNLGIAKALNIGCQMALKDGFKYCMTMDQDSIWDENQLEYFFSQLKDENKQVVSYAPYLDCGGNVTSVIGDLKRKILGKTLKHRTYNEEFPDCVIASGNVIKLSVWEKIGKFNENFFIDEVDNEFCYRLIENGYKIKAINAIMSHQIGNPKKTLFPTINNHHGIRLYYIFRNSLYIKDLHPKFFVKKNYNKMLFQLKKEVLLSFNISDIKYMYLGIRDYKQKKVGKYES